MTASYYEKDMDSPINKTEVVSFGSESSEIGSYHTTWRSISLQPVVDIQPLCVCVCVIQQDSEMMRLLNQDTVQGFCDQCH